MNHGYFGADYYPEHWPEERWPTDARLMQEMGLTVVRMGEFSWARFEPRLGEFDFTWLDKAIALLEQHGIKSIIGTPTATPPAWIIEQSPEILPVDSQGRVRGFGGRHHDCQSNPVYRAHIRRLVSAMAEHYAENPGVIGWQIDNELGNSHADLCHCRSCRHSFQKWLEGKYKTVDVLNQAWGTAFWSQTYDHFGQIPTPMILPVDNGHNPSHALDWKRFCSDLIVDFQQLQIDLIRQACPDHFITHNFMGFADKVNYFDLAEPLEFSSHDQYPMGFFHNNPPWQVSAQLSAALDLMRATKQKPFWIMEQQSGPAGWTTTGRTPKPGQLRLWTAHSIAHGADSIVYFRWRTCIFGTEEYWHGILPHSGQPGRRYSELQETVQQLQPVLDQLQGSMPGAEMAIIYSYDQKWAFDIQPHHPDLAYIKQVMGYYGAFYQRNIPVDFISEDADLSGYKLVVAPLQFLTCQTLTQRMSDYVQAGGQLVLTMRSGVKDMNNVCLCDGELPGPLSDLLGLEILDYESLRETDVSVCWLESGKQHIAAKWADIVTLHGAKALAEYASEYYAGTPAVTVNNKGSGKAYYVASELDETGMAELAQTLCQASDLAGLGESQLGVELTRRQNDQHVFLFALNHSNEQACLELDSAWQPLLGGLELAPYDFAIFRKPR